MRYFFLNKNIRITTGYKYGLIHDFNNRKIYRISREFAEILVNLNNGVPVESINGDFSTFENCLKRLSDYNVGFFAKEKQEFCGTNEKNFSNRIEMLWLNLTSKCNYKCLHCYEESSPQVLEKEKLTIDDYSRLIHNLKSKFGITAIQLIGGEPLLKGKDFIFKLLDIIIAEHIPFIEVYTNCALIDEEYCKYFQKNNIHLATSLYSEFKEKHDSITQVKGSYDNLLDKIKLLQKYKIDLRVSAVIMNSNKDEIKSLSSFVVDKLKVKNYKIDLIRPIGRGKSKKIMPLDLFVEQRAINPRDFCVDSVQQYDYNRHFQSCWGNKLCINSLGEVFPCIMSSFKICMIDDLEQKWGEGKSFRYINNDKVKICQDCEFRYICYDCKAMDEHSGIYEKPYYCFYNPYLGEWDFKDSKNKILEVLL